MRVILPDRSLYTVERTRCTIGEILAEFGINPLEVIVSVNGRIVPEDTMVLGDDRIQIIRITHGG